MTPNPSLNGILRMKPRKAGYLERLWSWSWLTRVFLAACRGVLFASRGR